MFFKILYTIVILSVLFFHKSVSFAMVNSPKPVPTVVAQKTYSLADRYGNSYVNNVFSDNILLTLAYMVRIVKNGQNVNWNMVNSPFTYQLILKPGQTFAFHDEILPQYKNSVVETTNAHFDSSQGFKSDGWLVGDGVCHLASFMNVVARSAGLKVNAPTPHNFAKIADVPAKFGVAIYYTPNSPSSSALQNLYITNNFNKPIAFVFNHSGSNLNIKVEKLN